MPSPITPPQHKHLGEHTSQPLGAPSPPARTHRVSHPGPWLRPSQPAPAAPAAAPWRCHPAPLTPSHCRGDEPAREPPRRGPPVLDPPSLAFLHRLCRPCRTLWAKGTVAPPVSPAGPKRPPRHAGAGCEDTEHKPVMWKGKLRHRGGTFKGELEVWSGLRGQPGKWSCTPIRPTRT